ncbi:MAG: outer membrane beta-barrel protein [Robiginitalea sp.]|uniref:outer membrane beta-barrel protein n=1 Tax=Robiginitalea sp. TaxID=1902411 RepID=UPI003C78020F
MRKILVIGCMLLFGASLQAQEGLNVGINLGLPVGDASDFSSFSLGIDANYLWNVAESLDVGVATGFTNAFGKTYEILGAEFDAEDVQFIPIAAAGRYHVTDKFRAGADIGYAIGLNDGNDGGFYYRPILAYGFNDTMEVNFSYTGISLDGFTWSTISLGFMVNL